jgi:metal-responsive CopG/Arc/MetJ family transcriptional regulator
MIVLIGRLTRLCYYAGMKRTTISIPEDLSVHLEREARRHGTSVSNIVRQALTAHFGLTGEEPRRLPFAALGHSGHRHTARDVEDILADEWDRASNR